MRRFYATQTPNGGGKRPNNFHAFTSLSSRDFFVATDPEHRKAIGSKTNLTRRMLLLESVWQNLPGMPAGEHWMIPYLDR